MKNHSDENATISVNTPTADSYDPTICDQWDGWSVGVPWPGETFMIIERSTNRTLVEDNGNLLLEPRDSCDGQRLWHCVMTKGFFGFQNKKTSKYISCNLKSNLHANGPEHSRWEYIVAYKHPKGGFQLLMPTWQGLKVIGINSEGNGLILRSHGTTTWDFLKND